MGGSILIFAEFFLMVLHRLYRRHTSALGHNANVLLPSQRIQFLTFIQKMIRSSQQPGTYCTIYNSIIQKDTNTMSTIIPRTSGYWSRKACLAVYTYPCMLEIHWVHVFSLNERWGQAEERERAWNSGRIYVFVIHNLYTCVRERFPTFFFLFLSSTL